MSTDGDPEDAVAGGAEHGSSAASAAPGPPTSSEGLTSPGGPEPSEGPPSSEEPAARAAPAGPNAAGGPVGGQGGWGTGASALAYRVAGAAAAALVAVVVLAAVDPTPGRHMRGLLVLVAIICLLTVACGWARTVWHLPAAGSDQRAKHVE